MAVLLLGGGRVYRLHQRVDTLVWVLLSGGMTLMYECRARLLFQVMYHVIYIIQAQGSLSDKYCQQPALDGQCWSTLPKCVVCVVVGPSF